MQRFRPESEKKKKYHIDIVVRVRELDPHTTQPLLNQGITVEHDLNIGAAHFLDLCRVLARFERLGEEIKEERGL